MFTTPEKVKLATNYDVSAEIVYMAQYVLEALTGRTEADVAGTKDFEIMARATAFQAAYMTKNYETVYEQVALVAKTNGDNMMTIDTSMFAPYLAPLAVLAMSKLSWYGPRSIHTGPMADRVRHEPWEVH